MKLSFVSLFLSALGSASASCDVDLFKMVGVTGPSADPIDIVRQDFSTVTFNITNKWGALDTDMDYVFVQYNDPITGVLRCLSFEDVLASWTSSEIEARCMVNKPISVITIYVADALLSETNVAELPPCCQAETGIHADAMYDMDSGVAHAVSYTYVLECAPVACAPADCAALPPVEVPEETSPPFVPTDPPGSDKDIDTNTGKSKNSHLEHVPNGHAASGPTCQCAVKTHSMADGEGFVTGGGWIWLDDPEVYLNATMFPDIYIANHTKANFGFNAMSRKGIDHGSTNFDIDGNTFHFHSATRNTPLLDLEVPDGVRARWSGTGHLDNGEDIYTFLVAVQDWGEPGFNDTWRIRIWKGEEGDDWMEAWQNKFWTGVDDTDWEDKYLAFDSTHTITEPDDTAEYDTTYWGTQLGDYDPAADPEIKAENAKGGGNIQIHKSKIGSEVMLDSDDLCICDAENKVNPTMAKSSFVTGGGWVNMTKEAMRCDDQHNNSTCYPVEGIRANFGFNAMTKKSDGYPDGSVNFDYSGNDFHFHSLTGGKTQFEHLEILDDCMHARWMGNGTLSTLPDIARRQLAAPVTEDDDELYGFMVAVVDLDEPGANDMWRIRVWLISESNTFHENGGNWKIPHEYVFDSNPTVTTSFPINETDAGNLDIRQTELERFEGTTLGDTVKNGGGNIQIHCKPE